MSQDPPPIEYEIGPDPSVSVIWLHGLGADGSDFLPIAQELQLPTRPAVRFIFPHAPMRSVTINQGQVMRAWYDLMIGPEGLEETTEDIDVAADIVYGLIKGEQERGIACDHIIVAGFSQGGAVALHTVLHYPQRVAGAIVLSAYLPKCDRDITTLQCDGSVPVFMAHGHDDPIVPFPFAEMSRECLLRTGLDIEWHDYPMQHSVCIDEISDLSQWITALLSRLSPAYVAGT
jgi:phospholipase/carboxylesterase